MKKLNLIALLLTLLLQPSPLAHANGLNGFKAFVVRKLTGLVLTRSPNSVKWREVEIGMRLGEGDLVQVTNGAAMTLRFRADEHNDLGGIKAAEATVNIDRPMIVRLERNLLRKARLETFFLNGLPTMAAANSPKTPETGRMSIEEAWHRVSAMFSSNSQQNNGEQKANTDTARQGIALSVSAKSIEIMSPINNGVIVGQKMPVEVHISWRDVSEQKPEYFLYVWDVDKARPEPVAITRQNFYTHLFMHYGSYQMQITTSNERWQSSVVLVHIVPPSFDAAQAKKKQAINDLLANAAEVHDIRLTYPPRDTSLVQKVGKTEVDFYWQMTKDLPVDHYQVILHNHERVAVQSVRATIPTVRLSLAHGTYYWRVEAFGADVPGEKKPKPLAKSVEHSVSVLDALAPPEARGFLHNFLISGAHGTIDLTTGL